MTNHDLLNINIQQVAQSTSGVVEILYGLLIALGVVLLTWGLLYILSFKHLVRVRKKTASGYVIIDTKAREYSTREGVKKWRLLKPDWIRQSFVAPDPSFLEFTKRGKFTAECDMDTDGSVAWRKRNNSPEGLDTFSSEEKLIAITEYRRSNDYNVKRLSTRLLEMAPLLITVMLVVVIFAFWGDFMTASANANSNVKVASDNLAEATEALVLGLKYCYGDVNISDVGVVIDTGGVDVPPVPVNVQSGGG